MRGSPRHPGESLREDWIVPLGLIMGEAAAFLGVEEAGLQAVCDCRAPITAELAVRIDRVFGGGDDVWFALQSGFSLARARERLAGVAFTRCEAVVDGDLAEVAD